MAATFYDVNGGWSALLTPMPANLLGVGSMIGDPCLACGRPKRLRGCRVCVGERQRREVASRFWSHVDKTGDCWTWTGANTGMTTRVGYGRFRPASRTHVLAHRWVYEQAHGPIPDGLELDHLCRNRLCVNPAHLEAVSHQVNMARGAYAQKTHCVRGHAYDAANTIRYRGRRRCRECHRVDSLARYYRVYRKASASGNV